MRRRNFKMVLRITCWILTSCVILWVITICLSIRSHYKPLNNQSIENIGGQPQSLHDLKRFQQKKLNVKDSQPERKLNFKNPLQRQQVLDKKKDWHDYVAMEIDAKRIGIGEQGKASKLDESQKELERKMSLQNGFNALLSDSISVNRSVPDIRHKDCHKQQYLAKLPGVSIVIIFWNEYFSVLMRSIHSVVNRSPRELLKEIILVDDHSDRQYLFTQLENYVAKNFPNLVRIIRLPRRTGLIGARLAGARAATAEVLIFLDSHIEANYNWLPPLLEPIVRNKRIAVCPFIDAIAHETFNYVAQDEGARGAFDWEFYYKRLPLLPEDLKHPARPFKNPVMAGGLFAISAEFFWELGGYDEGLDIWGGEQYELSFKIWMCGGEMYDAPCSRVGHIYRGPQVTESDPRENDYLHKNYKRVAEVWMDEYKQYLYEHGDGVYETIDAGDLSAQKAIRKKLQCKSFKWFMEEVAFDLVKTYPPVDPPVYASGAIQNVGNPKWCVDTLAGEINIKIGAFSCANDLQKPQGTQFWRLTMHQDLRLRRSEYCLDVTEWKIDANVLLMYCHKNGGNQYWYYNVETKQLIAGEDRTHCLEIKPSNPSEVVVNKCDLKNQYMQWNFGNINYTALKNSV